MIRRFPSNTAPTRYSAIWRNYAAAMQRRREPTDHDFLTQVWCDVAPYFLRHKESFLLGVKIDSIFIPTHFAPQTMRQGVELIKKSAQAKVIFAVTGDLVPQLVRCGFRKIPDFIISLASRFFHFPTYKVILFSPKVNLIDVAKLLLNGDYWSRRDQTPATKAINFRRSRKRTNPKHRFQTDWNNSKPTLAAVWPH